MDEQYLWDRTGTPDVEVARLEEVLGRLRHLPAHADWPGLTQRSRRHWLLLAGTAGLAAAVVLFLLRPRADAPMHTTPEVEAPVAEAPAAVEEPEPPAPPQEVVEDPEPEKTEASEGTEAPEIEEEGKQRRVLDQPKRRKVLEREKKPKCQQLTEKLTIVQVKSGFAKIEKDAKACGKKHGAGPGTKVKIKVEIEGRSGKVISSEPQGPHADTDLGRCVADTGLKARFPCFSKERMGVVYPFVM